LQPAICFDGSETGKILAVTDIGFDSSPHSNLVSFAVLAGGGASPTLSAATEIQTAAWVVPDNTTLGAPLLTPTQPDGTKVLWANDARLSAKVYALGGVLYAVNSTELNNKIAIRWYRVRASDNSLLEAGTIADANLDLFFPSIAANAAGVVVIAFNGCGLSNAISCYAQAGQTLNGVTSFGTRVLLQAGVTSYHGDDETIIDPFYGYPEMSRWGDYSATSVDPSDPNRFWTIQMFPSDDVNTDVYSTQITELITAPYVPTLLLSITKVGTNVNISWPNVPGFQLQSATNLAVAPGWSTVAQTPATNGSQLLVTLPATLSRQFFRLH
jgi:hypothetical protein